LIVTISYYAHVWQAFFMFLLGILSVLAAFVGYVQSGGAEELFRRALSNVGEMSYRDHDFLWSKGEIVVHDVRKKDFQWTVMGENKSAETVRFSGLRAHEVRLKLELFPWPPKITSVTVSGMPDTEIHVEEESLQSKWLSKLSDSVLPTIIFQECDLKLNIGKLQPLKLTGCGGEMRKTDTGDMRGNFSLSQLNDCPFGFKLESLEGGRWVLTGNQMQINTREALAGQTKLFSDKLDPVNFLARALFTGDLGAEGLVSSLKIVVQPSGENRDFTCDGEVGYENLTLKLPLPEQDAGAAVPYYLGQLIGVNGWPRWMQVDQIQTGSHGRVSFHMTEGVLNFSCDEGPGSAFTGSHKGIAFPPLENLKGAVETDIDGHPRRIVLRGFLGDQLDFETRLERNQDGSRGYDLILEPRSGSAAKIVFGKPLWRFISHVHDFVNVKNPPPTLPLADFEMEADARHFPAPMWLPQGLQDLSGHVSARGKFTRDNHLIFDKLSLDDGASITYGGPALNKHVLPNTHVTPLWTGLFGLLGTESAWSLQNLAIQGHAEVVFSPKLEWERTDIKQWSISSGSINYAGLNTDFGVAQLEFNLTHTKNGDESKIEMLIQRLKLWQASLSGKWITPTGKASQGTFTLSEKDVPLVLHPQRDTLPSTSVSEDKRRVNRMQTLNLSK
jgi:hypothetical protein